MKQIGLLILAALLDFGQSGYAVTLRNAVQQQDSADSLQTQRVCYAVKGTSQRVICLPLPYAMDRSAGMSFNFALKINDKALNILKRAYEKDIDESYVTKLFKEDNFQEASGSAAVRVIYRNTAISYTPTHFAGGFKLFNPSLPVVHVAGINESAFTLGHYFVMEPSFLQNEGEILFAPYVSFANQIRFFGDFDLLTATARPPKELIQKEKKKVWDGGASLFYYSKKWFIPTIGVRGENLTSADECDEKCKERYIDIDEPYRRRTSGVVGFSLPLNFGNAFVGTNLAFSGAFQEFRDDLTSAAIIYQLSKLNTYVSLSSHMRSFGFLFTGPAYKVGVQYTNEKQEDSLSIERTKKTYVYATIFI